MTESFWGAVEEDGIECAMSNGQSICGNVSSENPESDFHETGFSCDKCMNTIVRGGGLDHPLLEHPKANGSFQRWQAMLEANNREYVDQFECKGCAEVVGDAEER